MPSSPTRLTDPALLPALLQRRFKVPQLAAVRTSNAWLEEAVQLAWTEGVPQPAGVDFASLTIDSISDAHLRSIHAFFVGGASPAAAGALLDSTEWPPEEVEEHGAEGGSDKGDGSGGGKKQKQAKKKSGGEPGKNVQGHAAALRARAAALRARAGSAAAALRRRSAVLARLSSSTVIPKPTPEQISFQHRKQALTELLAWCKTSSVLSIPVRADSSPV